MKNITLIISLLLGFSNNSKANLNNYSFSTKYIKDTLQKPQYFSVITVAGRKINTKNIPNRIIVINFWFIACTPCRWELKQLTKLSNKYQDDSDIIFISISSMDGPEQLKYVKKRTGFSYQLVDSRPDICTQFNVDKYPTNIVVQNGKTLARLTGYNKNIDVMLSQIIDSIKDQ